MKPQHVRRWMSTPVITTEPQATLWEADELMNDNDIHCLPIVEAGGEVVGIITQSDLRKLKRSEGQEIGWQNMGFNQGQVQVRHLMTPTPIVIDQDSAIDEAAWLMLEGGVSSLPVLNEDQDLVGIITESDIYRVVVEVLGQSEQTYVDQIKRSKGGNDAQKNHDSAGRLLSGRESTTLR